MLEMLETTQLPLKDELDQVIAGSDIDDKTIFIQDSACSMDIKEQCARDSGEFIIKLIWCRRLSLRHCYIQLRNPDDKEKLIGSKIKIGSGKPVDIKPSSRNSNLAIYNLQDDVSPEQVKDALASALGICLQDYVTRFRVIMPRENIPYRPDEMEHAHKVVVTQVTRFVNLNKFSVKVLRYKEKSVYCMAYVTFVNEIDCKLAANGLKASGIQYESRTVGVTVMFKGDRKIQRRNTYEHIERDIDDYKKKINKRFSSETICLYDRTSRTVLVDISAPSQHKLAKILKDLDGMITGEVIEYGTDLYDEKLFTSEARLKFQEIEASTMTKVFINYSTRKITIIGLQTNRNYALREVEDYLFELSCSEEDSIDLKSESSPPGLLKALFVKYGLCLEAIKTETKLTKLRLDVKKQTIEITGDKDSLLRVNDLIKSVVQELILKGHDQESISEVCWDHCVLCLCSTDNSDFFLLQNCHHIYCKLCAASLVNNCTMENDFPLKCLASDCNACVAVVDIEKLKEEGFILTEKLEIVQAAVRSFVRKRDAEFRFCVSPMCGMVYKISGVVTCPQCNTCICTTCHTELHRGVTCKLYRRAKSMHK